jgi:hypothetical protein
MAFLSTAACEDYSTSSDYTTGFGSTGYIPSKQYEAAKQRGMWQSVQTQQLQQFEADYQQRMYQELLRNGVKAPTKQEFQQSHPATPAVKKGQSLMEEFRSYVREYKDWIFTVAIIAIVDHFFLDGALKEKLAGALGKKLDATPEGKSGGAQ